MPGRQGTGRNVVEGDVADPLVTRLRGEVGDPLADLAASGLAEERRGHLGVAVDHRDVQPFLDRPLQHRRPASR